MANTSYIRKNKNLINRILSEAKKFYNKLWYTYTACTTFKINDVSYAYSFSVRVRFNPKGIKVVEEKNKVYIGVDLDDCRYEVYDEDTLGNNLAYWFSDKIFPYWKSAVADENLKALAEKESYYEGDFKDYASCENFSAVKTAMDAIKDELNNKPIIELTDGEWPRLNDRSILPIMIISKDTGDIDYYREQYSFPYSYRVGRDSVSSFSITPNYIRYILNMKVPYTLTVLKQK